MNIHAAYIDYALRTTEDFSATMTGTVSITLTDYQLFTARVFLGLNNMNSLLLFQETGVGKTITAIYMLKHLKKIYSDWTIVILLKKALIEDPWTSAILRYAPEVMKDCIIMNYDDQNFYNKFFTNIKAISARSRVFIIIDECHNFISKSLSKNNKSRPTKIVYNYISKSLLCNNNKLLCLSATPIVNDLHEFYLLVNLLRPGILPTSHSIFHNKRIIDEKEMITKLGCICSYIVTNESSIFDDVETTSLFARKTVYIRHVTLSKKQEELYHKAKQLDRRLGVAMFKIFQRMAATFVFDDIPQKDKLTEEEYISVIADMSSEFMKVLHGKKITEPTLEILRKGGSIADVVNTADIELYNFLYTHSCKFTTVCVYILHSPGKCLVFEPFVKQAGIELLLQYFNVFNITSIEFSSRTKDIRSQQVMNFNKKENIDGDIIKVCVFSQCGNEGISFLSINDIFILDMTWNEASLKQIIGRAIRLNSHNDNPPDRKYVNVHFIVSKLASGIITVDDALLDIIQTKSKEFAQLYRLLKYASIEWIYLHQLDFKPIDSDAGFKKLISRPIVMYKSKINKQKLLIGENIWYSYSTALVSIYKGFKAKNGNIYDLDGFLIATLNDIPIIRIHNEKLIYILS